MHFCSECHNMYYLKVTAEDANSLIYYCRNCGHEDDHLTADNICVSDTQLRRSEQKYNHTINEYTKFDPTLPRINTIDCPNSKCASNAGASEAGISTSTSASEAGTSSSASASEAGISTSASEAVIKVEREVIYIRYDDTNMKYMYVCAICNTQWKNDK